MIPEYAVKFLGAIFAIMNPLTVLPLFLSLTDGMTADAQRSTALRVTFYIACLCAVVGVAGSWILGIFGITPDEFRVAGGLVVGIIGFGMLNGAGNPAHEGGPGEKVQPRHVDQIAFYPLAFPMIVGPGTITTLVVFQHTATTAVDLAFFAAITALMVGLIGLVLYFASAIGTHLSMTLRIIMSRLMGVILLAIGVSMVIAGLRVLLPGLA